MTFTTRPTLRGFGGAASAGHYLAAQAGAQMLAAGGNAADAACAMGFALQLLEPHMNGPAGEVPILYYEAAAGRVHVISGQGVAPAAATLELFQSLGLDRVPGSGALAATVPAALDAWCLLLERFGTRSFAEVTAPALVFATQGFPMYPFLRSVLRLLEARFRCEWPSSGALYLPLRANGTRQTNPAYGQLLLDLCEAEQKSRGTREQGIRAARNAFYRGRAAEEIEQFLRQPVEDYQGRHDAGLLTAHDLAGYEGRIESPISFEYRGALVSKCGPWTQGPVFLQQLALLEGFDLASLGHNSAEALHYVIEASKLAFADREACYGDPLFVEVPLARLLAPDYSARRRGRIERERASHEISPGIGKLPHGWPWIAARTATPAEPQALAAAAGKGDTTHCDAADAFGNLASCTPSGGWIPSSPVIPSLGFPVGTRAQMFTLDPEHPNALAPGKRPRTTLTPSFARLPDGRHIAFGTPGGDQQDQWTLQFFLNLVDFASQDLQSAIDAPTVHSLHAPSSFHPRDAQLGVVAFEARLERAVASELVRRGHWLIESGPWEHGRVMAVTHHPGTGLLEAASSPRSQIAYSIVF